MAIYEGWAPKARGIHLWGSSCSAWRHAESGVLRPQALPMPRHSSISRTVSTRRRPSGPAAPCERGSVWHLELSMKSRIFTVQTRPNGTKFCSAPILWASDPPANGIRDADLYLGPTASSQARLPVEPSRRAAAGLVGGVSEA